MARTLWLRPSVQGVAAVDPEYGMPQVTVGAFPAGTEIHVQYQGAEEDPASPGQPDLAGATPWSSSADVLDGHEFVRLRILFRSPDAATHAHLDAIVIPFSF
jgi:hypothetical protein